MFNKEFYQGFLDDLSKVSKIKLTVIIITIYFILLLCLYPTAHIHLFFKEYFYNNNNTKFNLHNEHYTIDSIEYSKKEFIPKRHSTMMNDTI